MTISRSSLTAVLALLLASCASSTPGADPSPSPTADGERRARCSAATLSTSVAAQPGLPVPVEQKRARIVEAAVACDYDGLDALGPNVSYSFGLGSSSAGAYWRDLEERDTPVLWTLVQVLGLRFGVDPAGAYVWPRVHAGDASEEDWEELATVFPAEDVERWRNQGDGYLGYRAGIRPDGEWAFFIAGD